MLSERHVQAIWYDAALRPTMLRTRRGSAVTVVSPGDWNLGAGPDFRNAVLEIGPEHRRIVGDVEVHLCPSDWDFHRHGTDPNYRNVVAHVTWGCGPDPDSLPPGAISIWLGRFMTAAPSFTPSQIDLKAYPFARLPLAERPCERAFGHDPDRAHAILAAAGRHRLKMKARRLAGRLDEAVGGSGGSSSTVRDQVFYEEVMTALGYVKNAAAFRHVAVRIPLEEAPRETAVLRRAYLAAGSFEEFDRGGLRPFNSPEERLAHAAELMVETPTLTFAGAVDFSRDGCRAMAKAMCGTRRREGDGGQRHCLGPGRAAAILSNVIVPFALAEERLEDAPDWLPPEDLSAPVRLTAFRLFGRDHNPAAYYANNGLLIQGLLQIHRDYCLALHPDCEKCTLR